MDQDPRWTKCEHLSAGTCPQYLLDGEALTKGLGARPESAQDMALERLALACETCAMAPAGGEDA